MTATAVEYDPERHATCRPAESKLVLAGMEPPLDLVGSLWLLFLLALLAPAEAASPPNAGNKSDAELLLAFKASFTNADEVLGGWTGANPCDEYWEGVQCSDSRVINL